MLTQLWIMKRLPSVSSLVVKIQMLFKRKLLIFSRATINSTYKSKNHENEQNSYVEVLRRSIIAILNETNI